VITWRQLLVETTETLGDEAEARWLCQEASGLEGVEWMLGLDERPTQGAVARLDAMVARRRRGEPLQYVMGHWPFRRLDLLVDRRVLIPRPETELVVEIALELAAEQPDPLVVADLGTGSGAIALAMADELFPRPVAVWACDTDEAALDVARANLAGVGRAGTTVRMAWGSWFAALPEELAGRLAVVVSNPPYLADDDPAVEPPVRDWEPSGALFAGPDGLDALREVIAAAPAWLRHGGALVCEIGAGQGAAVAGLAEHAGLVDVEIRPDLAGLDRVLVARRA
jgi:release factor glutamine methyltransferase